MGKYCCPCGLLDPGQVAEHCAPGQEVQTQSGSWLVSHGRGADLSRPGTVLGTRSVLSCPGLCRGGHQSLLGSESTGGQPRDRPRAAFLQVLLGEPWVFWRHLKKALSTCRSHGLPSHGCCELCTAPPVVFFFNLLVHFIFGCAGFSSLSPGLLWLQQVEATLVAVHGLLAAAASHCRAQPLGHVGFGSCGAWA